MRTDRRGNDILRVVRLDNSENWVVRLDVGVENKQLRGKTQKNEEIQAKHIFSLCI